MSLHVPSEDKYEHTLQLERLIQYYSNDVFVITASRAVSGRYYPKRVIFSGVYYSRIHDRFAVKYVDDTGSDKAALSEFVFATREEADEWIVLKRIRG